MLTYDHTILHIYIYIYSHAYFVISPRTGYRGDKWAPLGHASAAWALVGAMGLMG